tara:strand:- start:1427 stop:1684 length:258 start_codon:yes stop_codon:yes gene_type:complete
MKQLIMNQKQITKEKKVFIDELKSMKRTLKRQDYGPHTKLFLKVWFDMIVDKFNKSKNGKDFQDSIHQLKSTTQFLVDNHYKLLY